MGKTHITDENYQQMASAWSLNYDRENKVIHGERSGYFFLIYASNASAPLMFSIVTSATSELCPKIGNEEKRLIKSRAPMLTLVAQRDSKITALSTNTFDADEAQRNIEIILSALISFMMEKGFTSCCENCKSQEHIEILQTGFEYRHLCSQCEERIAQQTRQNMVSKKLVPVNSTKGIIGALIGSVIGMVCMTFLSSYANSIWTLIVTGIIVGALPVCISVYMGSKPSKTVMFAIFVLVILSVLVGYNVSFVMAFVVARDMSVGAAADLYFSMLADGMANMEIWIGRLVITYISAVFSSVISYRSAVAKLDTAYKIAHIGRTQDINGN